MKKGEFITKSLQVRNRSSGIFWLKLITEN
jgi:hypothetical protein